MLWINTGPAWALGRRTGKVATVSSTLRHETDPMTTKPAPNAGEIIRGDHKLASFRVPEADKFIRGLHGGLNTRASPSPIRDSAKFISHVMGQLQEQLPWEEWCWWWEKGRREGEDDEWRRERDRERKGRDGGREGLKVGDWGRKLFFFLRNENRQIEKERKKKEREYSVSEIRAGKGIYEIYKKWKTAKKFDNTKMCKNYEKFIMNKIKAD